VSRRYLNANTADARAPNHGDKNRRALLR
jgi:hypothetical protein